MEAQRSLIAEVETAIASGSADQRVETLRRVTDLFMVSAKACTEAQVDVFDDVITRLADQIETKARAELATRLAPVNNAPVNVVRALARDKSIDVAGPVLTHSTRLSEEDLLACAKGQGQDRLLAISRRATISEAVSDVLVTQGGRDVVRSVARNQGARFSNTGFGRLVERSAADDELAVSVGLRKDISKEHFHTLVSKASEAVFKKLAASNPAAASQVNRVLFELTGHKTEAPRNYVQAKAAFEQLQRSGSPIEAAVQIYASTGKFEETVVAIAGLCQLPVEAAERILGDKQADHDLALLLIKAAGMTWPTAKLILEMRRGEMGIPAQTLDMAHRHFEKLQASTAKRVIRFYQVRQASTDKASTDKVQ